MFFRYTLPVPMWIVHGISTVFSLLGVIPNELFLQKVPYRTCSYYVGLEFGPLFQVWGVYMVVLSLYGLGILIRIAWAVRGARKGVDRTMVMVLIGASSMWLVTALADCLTGIQVLDLPPQAWLGSLCTTVAIAGVLINHIDRLYQDRSELYQELIHDQLTGAFSRGYFELRLSEAVRRNVRNPGASGYVVMLDIDDFKLVNDSYGHPVGDEVLCGVVEALSHSVRESDTVARLGGDEFALLLMDVATDEQVRVVIMRIQEYLSRLRFEHAGVSFSVTCSFGSTRISEPQYPQRSMLDLITVADDAMYEAKRAGKNALRVHSSGAVETT